MPRKQKKYHYIYKTTCDVSGRYYVGMHSTNDLEDGYLGSGIRLRNSINYHGKDKHHLEILEFFDNREKLKVRESELVNEELLKDPMCMNLTIGGQGGSGPGELNGFFGKRHTPETEAKVIKNLQRSQERFENDPVYRQKFINKMSKGLKDKWDRDGHPWVDRKHTDETKKKMSNAGKKRVGKNNSQYGTCWVIKGNTPKKIKGNELEDHLNDGWRRGRK